MFHRLTICACAGVSTLALASAAWGQDRAASGSGASVTMEDIIVTARRREESSQDVPLVVNAVSSESIAKLNIRDFKDIATIVPGLQLQASPNGVQPTASIRGVANDTTAAGNNGTIQFYLNEAPIALSTLLTSMFDIGQIEVLRGPQGTLRGRAAPSGSMTVTTRQPNLHEIGGYVTMTGQTNGVINVNAAIGVPIIKDVLAIRVAGLHDEGPSGRIWSINNGVEPYSRTSAERVSVRFDPTNSLTFNASFTNIDRKGRDFPQVESANIAEPFRPASPVTVTAQQRLAVSAAAQPLNTHFRLWNWQGDWRIAGQRLVYVGSHTNEKFFSFAPGDVGNAYAGLPDIVRFSGQPTNSNFTEDTHELRLQSDERLFGFLDYVVGGFMYNVRPNTVISRPTLVFVGAPSSATFFQAINTEIRRESSTKERSIFGNLTFHIGDKTDISGGGRYIRYKVADRTIIPSIGTNSLQTSEISHWIYAASVNHRFSDSLMAYASIGSSWRPGTTTNGLIDTNGAPSPVEARLQGIQPPETSTSYEVGFKSDLFDRRLRLNVTAFHQTFQNYIISVPNIYVANTDPATGAQGPRLLTSLGLGVPAKVDGIEGEFSFKPSNRWSLSASVAYARSRIRSGGLPCNNFPVPPANNGVITGANGGETIGICTVNYTPARTAPFSATTQSEYSLPLGDRKAAFLRSLITFNGKSQNDASNPFDDVKAFALVNLFAGIRDPDGAWELSLFAKNLFDVRPVINRAAVVANAPVQIGRTSSQINSTYRQIQTQPGSEFGLTLRFSFGSH